MINNQAQKKEASYLFQQARQADQTTPLNLVHGHSQKTPAYSAIQGNKSDHAPEPYTQHRNHDAREAESSQLEPQEIVSALTKISKKK